MCELTVDGMNASGYVGCQREGMDTMNNQYELQNHNGEKIGSMVYFDLPRAKAVAARTIAKWKKNPALRGNGLKIVQLDTSGSIYPNNKVIEWFHSA